MASFEERFLECIRVAQNLKLARNPDYEMFDSASYETFKQAVMNIYQLLGAEMPDTEKGAYTEATDFYKNKMQPRMAKFKELIERDKRKMDPDDQAWKPRAIERKQFWELYDELLTFLSALGHKYRLYPRMARAER